RRRRATLARARAGSRPRTRTARGTAHTTRRSICNDGRQTPGRPGRVAGGPRESLTNREGLRQLSVRARAGVDVDLARFDDELATVVVEAEAALVEPERNGLRLARIQRDTLEPAQAAHRLRDAGNRVVDIELHDLVAGAATCVRHGHGGRQASVA